jgi:hypothetical protein
MSSSPTYSVKLPMAQLWFIGHKHACRRRTVTALRTCTVMTTHEMLEKASLKTDVARKLACRGTPVLSIISKLLPLVGCVLYTNVSACSRRRCLVIAAARLDCLMRINAILCPPLL